ncbi:hypothetical protein FRC02_004793 [Tulasnella sp. 418]|nr:hypothetical protein FRC02_004793 [Tulasnella sp. 418]
MRHESPPYLPLSSQSTLSAPRRSESPSNWDQNSWSQSRRQSWATIRLTPRRTILLLTLLSTAAFYATIGSRVFTITMRPGISIVPNSTAIDSFPCVEEIPILPTGSVSASQIYELRRNGEDVDAHGAGRALMRYLLFDGNVLRDTSSHGEHIQESPELKRPFSTDGSLRYSCLESYVTQGVTCSPGSPSSATKLDILWTYSNGTDPLHIHARKLAEAQFHLHSPSVQGNTPQPIRDFGELQFSIRSVLEHFRSFTKKLHVVVSDFEFPICRGDIRTTSLRLAQIPQWLTALSVGEAPRWVDGDVEMRMIPHSRLFGGDYSGSTFNSLAIESRFPRLRDLGITDAFVYMNDDIFFASELESDDFYSLEHGPIFRMQSDLLVEPKRPKFGEWSSLHHSNDLLNARFGYRSRPYLTHTAKTLLIPFLYEIDLIWSSEFDTTASHIIRELNPRYPDVAITYMMTHFVVERWREGLLWSWIVGKLGGRNDEWDDASKAAWKEVGGSEEEAKIVVYAGQRDSVDNIVSSSTVRLNKATTIAFSSQDGYPYTGLGPSGFKQFPSFKAPEGTTVLSHHATRCIIEHQRCFKHMAKPFSLASEFFKHVAFREPTCGDCIISALVTASGRQGLKVFLPPQGNTTETNEMEAKPSYLPLTSNWEKTDFSLNSVTNTTNLRSWTIRLIHRYRFLIGLTPTTFTRLQGPAGTNHTLSQLSSIPAANKSAMICINDDVEHQPELVGSIFRDWMQKEWPVPAQWESKEH